MRRGRRATERPSLASSRQGQVGNRVAYEFDQAGEASELGYEANGLNQYERTRFVAGSALGQRLFYDPDGNLTHAKLMADMDCNGSVNAFDIQFFVDLLPGAVNIAHIYPAA